MTTFQVYGTPAPKGSKRGFVNKKTGGVILVESSDKVRPWQEAVKHATLEHFTEPMPGALYVEMNFFFPRPKGHYRTGKYAGLLKDSAPVHPITRPDADKCARSTGDALKDGGAYTDDSQIVELVVRKVYADNRLPGAEITIHYLW